MCRNSFITCKKCVVFSQCSVTLYTFDSIEEDIFVHNLYCYLEMINNLSL